MTHATLPSSRIPWNRIVQGLTLALAAATLVVVYGLLTSSAPVTQLRAGATQESIGGTCEWARDLPATWLPGIGAEPACDVASRRSSQSPPVPGPRSGQ